MAKNRLSYETKGGNLSESDTYAQLLEYLRMSQECCYMLGHLRKANDDEVTGQGFIACGELFKKLQIEVTRLATGKFIQ